MHHGFDLRRTPTDRPLKALVTCPTIHVCMTHFWGGRTVPCEAPDCEACEAMSPSRAHVYLSALESNTRDHFLFECTARAALPFKEWLDFHGTLLGCYFTAHRPKRRRNGPVEIICRAQDLSKVHLPYPPDITRAMAVIWQLPARAIQTEGALNSIPKIQARTPHIDQQLLNLADGQRAETPICGNGRRT